MKDLQVKYTDPLDLIPYENNPISLPHFEVS